ncbi:MAG: radical SAM protein [Planctomycetales bacterium]|nr:radical SAM protein [Planctomycetales bacterium]
MTDVSDDRFAEKTTAHIRRLAETSEAMRKMYLFDPQHETLPVNRQADLFLEKKLTVAKGVVCKYPGRAIILLSYTCAANCRYCERQDRVGAGLDEEGRLSSEDIRRAAEFVAGRPDVNEVIFSGGDPLTHPRGLVEAALAMNEIEHVKVLRIHTRYPLQLPDKVDYAGLERIANLRPMSYLSLHVDHPDELTPATEAAIDRIRRMGYILICQSVLLKGVNDDVDLLEGLFTRLAQLGVRPYYLYHCHPIATTLQFVMTLEEEIALVSRLRERLSGIACPQHIFEMRGATGKVLAPSDHWDVDLSHVRDFNGIDHDVVRSSQQIDYQPSPEASRS